MKKRCSFPFVFLLALLSVSLEAMAAEVKVILTGNTADYKNYQDLFDAIETYCTINASPVMWVLNGDIFPSEWNDAQIHQWQGQINTTLDRFPQLQILVNQGDRDWSDSGRKGWKQIQSLEKALLKNKHSRFQLFLKQGCPGPWSFKASPSLTFIVLNSQWWNHPFEKPIPSNDACTIADTDIFIEELEGILDDTNKNNAIILSHFPLESLGRYGGRFPLYSHLLPPVFGSACVGYHQNVGTSKDINNARFDEIRTKLLSVLASYSSVVFASGHERNQSIIKSEKNFFINSGAPEFGDYVAANPQAMLTSSHSGFIELTYTDNGEVRYNQLSPNGSPAEKNTAGILIESSCTDTLSVGAIRNTRYQPCGGNYNDQNAPLNRPVLNQAVAGSQYKSRRLKERWFGKHYRRSWTTPVNVSYLNMDTTHSGLLVTGKGGGRQTTSLKLSGEDKKEYVFRSVDKDPSKALAYELRGTVVSEVLKDQTTTQQPYGALAVAPLMAKIDLLHATPELYLLPDDKRLGPFRMGYANLFGMLEERPNDKIDKDKIFGGANHIEKSFQLFEKIYHDHDNRIESQEFARARMFDLWIGDWSKHEDNWKWAGYKMEGGEVFRPIPRDRDHAFSRWDGIIPWIADREWAMPNGENFDYKIRGLQSLMWQARHLDRFAANELTKQDWTNAAKQIQAAITDEDISAAVHAMPKEIYDIDGREIEDKLKARIKDLPFYAESYYAMLAKEVDVVGSNKEEYFLVKRNKDESVEVSVFELDKKNQQPILSRRYYHRTFLKTETKEIRLFGLNDDDVFVVEGESDKSILVRVISGQGHDRVDDKSAVDNGSKKTLIYDEGNDSEIVLGREGKRIVGKDPQFYQYDRAAFKYNTYLPLAVISYNSFTGAALHGGVTFTRHRFGKPDFSSKHRLRGSVSTRGNYELSYGIQLRHLIGKWDGVSEAILSRPLTFNYFFGVGNDTEQAAEQSDDYYRTQYNHASVSAGLTRAFWNQSRLSFIATYEIDNGISRAASYLNDHPEVFGVEKLHLFFIDATLDIDFRDRPVLAEHGFRFVVSQSGGHVQHASQQIASITEVEVENYFSTYAKNPLTFGIRLGGGTTSGELPFYKLFSLGQLNDLHGFKRNRFTGQSKAFLNSELRWQLTRTQNTFVPLKIGIRAFYDVGRVWADSDTSVADYWHQGYGGGFYITPFREQFAFNVSAGSSREEPLLLMFSVGTFLR